MKFLKNFFLILLSFLLLQNCNMAQKGNDKATAAADGKSYFVTPAGDTIQKVIKSDAEWKKELTAQEFEVLRQKGTERAFTGDLLKVKENGVFTCAACGFPLFSSKTKFESGTGWPSFYEPLHEYSVAEEVDNSHGMRRVEVLCPRCGGHLGHVFEDGPAPTGLRYCINSVSLDFEAKK